MDVKDSTIRFYFPPIYKIEDSIAGNSIRQLAQLGYSEDVTIETIQIDGTWGYVLTVLQSGEKIFAVVDSNSIPSRYSKVVKISTAIPFPDRADNWLVHPLSSASTKIGVIDFPDAIQNVLESWKFSILRNSKDKSIEGLRPPQIGALHAILAHWTVSNDAATVVLPTGTGKTDTMIATLAIRKCERVLVVVPSDVLRTQIANNFEGLGVLKEKGVLPGDALFPIVGTLKHKPKNTVDLDEFFEKCQVIVTTMAIAGTSDAEIQERMAKWCPYLFIDEAHHIGAKTWGAFKQKFAQNKILQFTATPFRNDGKAVGGKIIFNYPLSKAQEEGYFRKIIFDPILEYDLKKSDRTIADKAVTQLRRDNKKYNHILMARVDSIKRVKEVFSLYQKYHEFKPIELHTDLSDEAREKARKALLSKESKIVVCVDMLGEGFDLPELKIAAFHDVKKSLPITLQLIGRFIRSRADLGDPTVIANIAEPEVKSELRKLYSQDADWNALLPQTTQSVIQREVNLWEFISGFTNIPEEIPVQNITAALSTVIYKTNCTNWQPNNFEVGLDDTGTIEQLYHDVNHEKNVLIVIIGRKTLIDWAQVKDIYNLDWELLVLHWDQGENLLYINGSGNNGYYKKIAEAVAGNVELIKDEHVFRSLFGINRLRLQNVGLIDQNGRLIRYTMRAGSDIDSGLADAQRRLARKANIFGVGFEDGEKTSIGCSYKGRIWSRRSGNIDELITWCEKVGKKVTDITIDPNELLKGTLLSKTIKTRPNKTPIWIDWPEIFYNLPDTNISFNLDNKHFFYLYQADINLIETVSDSDFQFAIKNDDIEVKMTLSITEAGSQFRVLDNHKLSLRIGKREISLTNFFEDNQPIIYFNDSSTLEGNSYTEVSHLGTPYLTEKLITWDWSGVNICKESQGVEKDPETVQFRVIQELKKGDYALIFDDDNSGEIADVIAIKDNQDSLDMELYHCKFSGEKDPGGRIDDLYTVCGQAQKCTHWKEKANTKPEDIFKRMIKREISKQETHQISRIELGCVDLIETMKVKSFNCPIRMKVYIVQPGLSKSSVTDEQLRLLAVTESYLMQTYMLPFSVICSP